MNFQSNVELEFKWYDKPCDGRFGTLPTVCKLPGIDY